VSPPPRTRAPAGPVPVDALRHDEKRANIPTEELHDFVAEDERTPGQALYPRDPSLDPQLVWKGKDEQDREPLAVPSVPITSRRRSTRASSSRTCARPRPPASPSPR